MEHFSYINDLNIELDKFISQLNKFLPRYAYLLDKKTNSEKELIELGEIEYQLIEINARIADLKRKIEQDLFGLSLVTYYKLKKNFMNGDKSSGKKMIQMKKSFQKALNSNDFINWN